MPPVDVGVLMPLPGSAPSLFPTTPASPPVLMPARGRVGGIQLPEGGALGLFGISGGVASTRESLVFETSCSASFFGGELLSAAGGGGVSGSRASSPLDPSFLPTTGGGPSTDGGTSCLPTTGGGRRRGGGPSFLPTTPVTPGASSPFLVSPLGPSRFPTALSSRGAASLGPSFWPTTGGVRRRGGGASFLPTTPVAAGSSPSLFPTVTPGASPPFLVSPLGPSFLPTTPVAAGGGPSVEGSGFRV